jgi:hypothetical protein
VAGLRGIGFSLCGFSACNPETPRDLDFARTKPAQAEAYATSTCFAAFRFIQVEYGKQFLIFGENTMTTEVTTKNIGEYAQLAGIGAIVVGAILSVHHYAIGACILLGAAAYYVGTKLKAA